MSKSRQLIDIGKMFGQRILWEPVLMEYLRLTKDDAEKLRARLTRAIEKKWEPEIETIISKQDDEIHALQLKLRDAQNEIDCLNKKITYMTRALKDIEELAIDNY